MILAEIPEQLIFVVVMLVIAAIKAMGEKFGKKKEPTYEEYEEDNSVETDYEEYARQLRERQAEILARQQADAPPPLPSAAPVVFEKPDTPPVVKKHKLSAAEQKALENFQKGKPGRKKSAAIGIGTTARARARRVLSSPTAARDAIVLSEILGPPKGQKN